MNRLGARIKRKREMLSLPLSDLSKKVGISASALSQIENSKAFPSIVTLKSIANSLYTTVGELIGEHEYSLAGDSGTFGFNHGRSGFNPTCRLESRPTRPYKMRWLLHV